ncbi:MAG: ComEC family competence protein [Candidatus Omnitrophica bacterium]|nr:ComEC family competence protein [Candidatus Omnitrophota bacterium]
MLGNKAKNLAFFCAVFFCGAVCLANYDAQPGNHYRNIMSSIAGSQCIVSGRIAGSIKEENSRCSYIISAKRITCGSYYYGCSGDLLVIQNGRSTVEPGRTVEATGTIGCFPKFGASGRKSLGEYYRQKNILAVLRVKSAYRTRQLKQKGVPGITTICARASENLRRTISLYLPRLPAAVMKAMLLGYKSEIPKSVYNDMIKSGTVHILVVSGFNVGVVAGILALVLKVLRINRMMRLIIIIPGLVFYCLMTGASPPVVRATIMGIFFFLSWYLQRDPDIFQALCISAFAMLAVRPSELFDASFQLSFASVFSICCLSPRIERFCRIERIPVIALRRAVSLVCVSLAAWTGTSGFIAYYFRIIAPVTVLANILIPVLASLITLCGIGLAASGYLCPYIAISFASVSEFLIVLMIRLNSLFINFPGAYFRLP